MTRLVRDILHEVRFEDAWPKGFKKFRDEWMGKKEKLDLFVQFTSHMPTDLDRNPHGKPDHSDPVAVYGYPLKYVIDHPGDIWYGHNTTHVRVLQDTSRKCLWLSYMDKYEAERLVDDMRLGYGIAKARKVIKDDGRGAVTPGKLFFTCLQLKLDQPRIVPGSKRREYDMRSGPEQAALLKKLGFDAFRDDAGSISRAAVNDREPQQIGFLNRHAFKVLATYRMSDRDPWRAPVRLNQDRLERKYAAALAEVMKDTIAKSDGFSKFTTKGGRTIAVSTDDVSQEWRMKNLKIGQKKHKMFRKSTEHTLTAKIKTEHGDFTAYWWNDDPMWKAISDFAGKWMHAS